MSRYKHKENTAIGQIGEIEHRLVSKLVSYLQSSGDVVSKTTAENVSDASKEQIPNAQC